MPVFSYLTIRKKCQYLEFFVFSSIRTEYRHLLCKSLSSVRIAEKYSPEKLPKRRLFTLCNFEHFQQTK